MAKELFIAAAETSAQTFTRLSNELDVLLEKSDYQAQKKEIMKKLNQLFELDKLIDYMVDSDHITFQTAILNFDIELVNYLLQKLPEIHHFAMFSEQNLWRFVEKAVALPPEEYRQLSGSIRQILIAILALDRHNDPEDRELLADFQKGLEDEEEKPSYQAFIEDLNKAAEKAAEFYDQDEESDTLSSPPYPQLFRSYSSSEESEGETSPRFWQ